MFRKVLYLLIMIPSFSYADFGMEDFLWAASGGQSTNPNSIQDEHGGYIVKDMYGNETWVDDINDPECSFTSTYVEVNEHDFHVDEIVSEVYIGDLDLGYCNE